MMRVISLVMGFLIFVGCASMEFYAPEISDGSNAESIVLQTDSASVAGITVKNTSTDYSPVVSVGNLLMPAYQGSRRAVWTLEGPESFKAQLEVIQSGLIFSGAAFMNELKSDSIDFTKASTTLRLTTPEGVLTAEYAGVKNIPDVVLGSIALSAHYQGSADGKVNDYQSFGLVTGLRIREGEKLLGYISLIGLQTLYLTEVGSAGPLPLGAALALSRPQFAGGVPALKITPDEVDFFGLRLKSSVTHN